jgi:hypothetical protein
MDMPIIPCSANQNKEKVEKIGIGNFLELALLFLPNADTIRGSFLERGVCHG